MRITKYGADGTPITSGIIAVAFSATPTGIFDSSVSTSGGIVTITLSLDNQTGNVVLASPSDGSSGTPAFRALVAADLPTVTVAKGGTGSTSLTANALLVGEGTSQVSTLAPGTSRNVAISDGTDWTSRALALADVPNATAILWDEKTTGTSGGSSSAATWNARDLNTEHYDPAGIVTLSSNKFTPIAGDYILDCYSAWRCATGTATTARNRLYNVTAATSVKEGLSISDAVNAGETVQVNCKFTANGTDEFRIDTYTSQARTANGLGAAVGDGSPEIFTVVILRKVG